MIAVIGAGEAALWAVPVASAIISMAALVLVALGVRRSATAAHVSHLENELADARAELETVDRRLSACEEGRKQLRAELADARAEIGRMGQREIQLLRLVVNLESKAGGPA